LGPQRVSNYHPVSGFITVEALTFTYLFDIKALKMRTRKVAGLAQAGGSLGGSLELD